MLNRKIVSQTAYRSRIITLTFLGPDFMAHVDDIEMSAFYTSEHAAISGAQRYINDALKAKGD
jgi:hypothetical protein